MAAELGFNRVKFLKELQVPISGKVCCRYPSRQDRSQFSFGSGTSGGAGNTLEFILGYLSVMLLTDIFLLYN